MMFDLSRGAPRRATALQLALTLTLTSIYTPTANCQFLQPQVNTFNSTFNLTDTQIAALNFTAAVANNVNIAVRFERTNWATGSVHTDPFYTDLPANASTAPAGSLLKLEAFTNVSTYTIAPTLALSRFIYQSETLNGTLVPVSAYILWPYLPYKGASVAPLVSWGHGTAGIVAECGPSHMRNLLYQFSAPYNLALQGFAVIATDYAGLGVPYYPDGKTTITHQYLAAPASGNDILYAAQAAYAAFPDKLTQEFVVMGHSQGGGAAWGAAQQQLVKKIPGYLGTIAASPITNVTAMIAYSPALSLGVFNVVDSIRSVFPDLSVSSLLSSVGEAALKLLGEVQGCSATLNTIAAGLLTADPTLVVIDLQPSAEPYLEKWQNLTVAGGRDFAGPMLVLQGIDDTAVPEPITTAYVNLTCSLYPQNELEYVTAQGINHVPLTYATQQLWLDWLGERFSSVKKGYKIKPSKGCSFRTIGGTAPRPLDEYTGDLNYFLELALDSYQVA